MEDWKEYTVQQLIDLGMLDEPLDGNHGGKHPKSTDYVESGVPFIMANDLKGGSVDLKNCYFITEEQANSLDKGFSKPGDVLITHKATLGRTAIVPKLYDRIVLTPQVTYYRCKKDINNLYLKYYFDSPDFQKLFANWAGAGSTRLYLGITAQRKLPIRLPPLPTQQKIAQILSSLDDKIELNNKINANLEQQAQALFKNWFVDSQEKNGTIGDYCNVKSGFAFKSSWWQDSGLKVVRIGDIEQGKLSLDSCAHVPNDKSEIAKDFILKGGDLVIAMTGATIGKFSMVPKTDEVIFANQRVGKFFLGENPIERVPFLYCTLCNEEVITEFINRGQGSAQPNISTGDILSIPCWIPESSEIERFNKTAQPLFETIISNQSENKKLSNLRDTLLPKLMNGEVKIMRNENE